MLLFSNSCSTSDSELSGAKIYIAKGLQDVLWNEYARGQERKYVLQEISEDKSQKDFQEKVIRLYGSVQEIDKEAIKVIKFIEETKHKMFQSFGENMRTTDKKGILKRPYSEKDPLNTSMYDLNKVHYTGSTNILDTDGEFSKLLIPNFQSFRKSICELIANSVLVEKGQPTYYFKDPMINDYSTVEDFAKQIDAAINTSHVAQDDREALKKIYMNLSHNSKEWAQLLIDDIHWADALNILLQLELDVLKARADAISLIGSRFSYCGSSFNKILPMVFGPEVAQQNEEVYFEVLMAAYDSNKQPEVEAQGAEVVSIKDGKAKLKVNVGNAKEVTIKGTITIKNKSGVPKTQKWSKRIVVLPKE